jgi:acyl dehydratase
MAASGAGVAPAGGSPVIWQPGRDRQRQSGEAQLSPTSSPRARRLAVGDALPPIEAVVDADRQRRYHAAAEVRAGLFGDFADVSILANDTIHATRPLNEVGPAVGLHLGQRLRQSAPIRLGERLAVEGEVAEVTTAARGTRIAFAFRFRRPDGSVPLTSDLLSLRVDAAAMRDQGLPPPLEIDRAGYEKVAEKALSPASVAAYSREFPDYLVHFDPEAAAGIGLRAPVAQGLMSLTWMLEALARDGVPKAMQIEAQFRRPVFWDETVAVWARAGRELLCIAGADRVCSVGQVAHVSR